MAYMYTLIVTAKVNDVDPQAWLAGHERHQDMVRGQGAQANPDDSGIDRILDAFERLAARWAPRSRKAPSRRLN